MFLTEIEEGHEPEVFWVALGGEDDYGSLLTGTLRIIGIDLYSRANILMDGLQFE